MTTLNKRSLERQEIEALLPWHATGTLSRRDADRVEQALVADRDLARCYDVVREELNETIHLNETLGAPSARALEKLFAAIEAETPVARKPSFNLGAWLTGFVSGFSPRTIAWTAAAATIAIVVQAAVLTTVVVKDQTGGMGLASHETGDSLAIVRFTPQATAADITKFLDAHKAVMVDGPKKGGMFTMRLPASGMSKPDVAKLVQQMQTETKIVEFIAAKQ
jgi:anti-sigma-K factor RskA